VTIVDPRHPLYGQTFPLLHLKNKQQLVPSCLIRLAAGAERLVPLAVTDLALSPPTIYASPLDLSSLHNLIKTFARLQAQGKCEREDADERAKNQPPPTKGRTSGSSVADAESEPAAKHLSNSGPDVSNFSGPLEPGGKK
jgi:hypothetical protein